jgi:sn-glycerol 3-phosphate transport system substrate-binding protein
VLLFKQIVAAIAMAASALTVFAAAPAPAEIRFWHSMTGASADRVNSYVERFNQSQKNFKVVPVYKGSYLEAMAAMISNSHSGNGPDIIQVSDLGTAAVLAGAAGGSAKHGKSLVKPFYQVMAEAGQRIDAGDYLPAVSAYYSDKTGRMLSFPFDSSTPVLYYNKDAFKKAGLDPNLAPKTWPELQAAIQAVMDVRATPCGYTTGWGSWVHVENLHAWDDEEFATKLNGFEGAGTELVFNDRLEVRHIALLAAWLKGKLFSHSRNNDEAQGRFAAGECAVLTGSSAAYADIRQNAKFDFAVSRLPYYEDYKDAPLNTIVGGSSLWAMAGKKPTAYKGIAQFLSFLSQPELQAEWHQKTGNLPLTFAAYQLSKKQGYYEQSPGAEIPVLEVSTNRPTPISKGIRLGNFPQIRQVIDEELENVWNGSKPAKAALDDAVKRGNELLRKFDQTNK